MASTITLNCQQLKLWSHVLFQQKEGREKVSGLPSAKFSSRRLCPFGAQGRHLVVICAGPSCVLLCTERPMCLLEIPLYLKAVQGSTLVLLGSNPIEVDINKQKLTLF